MVAPDKTSRLYLKKKKRTEGYGSKSGILAQKVSSLDFKPQYHQKNFLSVIAGT
jgi:hypothetical protein